MMAVMFLPRQFQVTVVENVNEDHLNKAIRLFPLYLLAINIFVLPIAFGGVLHFTDGGVDADTFVLTLPMAMNNEALTMLVFIGGMSAATGMVIIATIALSTMICNDLVMPVLLRLPRLRLAQRSDLSNFLLTIRRGSIVLVLWLVGGVAMVAWALAGGVWGDRQRFSLVAGALGFMILLTPIIEFDSTRTDNPTGMLVVGLAFLIFLVFIGVRVWRRTQRQPLNEVVGEENPV